MIDKEKIKEEIERRLMFFSNECNETRILSELLQFIDSLPKEPVSENLEEEIDRYYSDWQFDDDTIYEDMRDICRHFAEWQKQKDFEELLKSDMSKFKECYEKGKADAMKEIMKGAVEGTVVGRDRSTMPPFQTKCKIVVDRVSIDAKEDDKVKVIIVKNE